MSAAFDAFIGVLQGAGMKTTGGGMWTCPAHKDQTPSLSVKDGGAGRVLVHCFAGCETESVLGALGRGWDALFTPDGPGTIVRRWAPSPNGDSPAAGDDGQA